MGSVGVIFNAMLTYLITIIILSFTPVTGTVCDCSSNYLTTADTLVIEVQGCRDCATGCYNNALVNLNKLQPPCGGEPFRVISSVTLDSIHQP